MSSEDHVSIEGTLFMLDDTTPHVSVVVQAVMAGDTAERPVAKALSDGSGKYRLINLKPGTYQVRCYTLNGYLYYSKDGPVDASHATSLQVQSGKTLDSIDFRFAPFKKGTWKTYTCIHGLADSQVNVIYRDSDGVMWFGTLDGVSRYDGREFVDFTTKDGLASNWVGVIYRDAEGIMWFGTWGGGLSRYDGKEFTTFTTEDGLAHNVVYGIHRDQDGVVWFATLGGGVSRYDGKEFVNLTTEDGLVNNNVAAIHRDPDGVMWFGTYGGISRYDGEKFTNFPAKDEHIHSRIVSSHCCSDGVIWFGKWGGGISRYDGKEFTDLTTEDGLAANLVFAIDRDQNGVMWFGTLGGGVSRYDGEEFVSFTTEDGLGINAIRSIHCAPDGVIWFGTAGAGVSCYNEKELANLTTKDGLAHNDVLAIYPTQDDTIWFGTDGGVSRYDRGKFVNFTTKDGLAYNRVYAVHQDSDGVMWFGTHGVGLSRYDGKEFLNFTTEDGLVDNTVFSIHRDAEGMMWFGTDGGVSRYDGKEFVNFTTKDGLVGRRVIAIQQDPNGVIWFASEFGGISKYSGKEFVNLTTKDGLAARSAYAIHRDPDGVMWFGTGGGVSRYDGREFVNLTKEDGLAHNLVLAIHRDPDGVMWFGTAGGGVSHYDGTAWASLDTRDGLAGNNIASIHQDSEGVLWFATERGITRYIPSTTPPKVRIVSVTTDQTYYDLSAIPAVTPGTRITIECNSVDFRTLPEKRQYRYRIKELDSDWRKATRTDSFDFAFNKPGTYTFEVQAIDRDLNYSEPASVKLEVIPDPRNHQIAQLKGELAERERAELERVQQELEDARQIQQSLLPDKAPEVEGFEIAGISKPAKEVSGDFYSYLSLGDNVGIVLADVTGKSVKAAMVATLADGMLNEATKSRRELWNSPGMILSELNMGLHPRLMRGMFTAISLGIIQPGKKRLVFSNAGMLYPLVKRGSEVWELEVVGMPLGLMEKTEYEDLSINLEAGDYVMFRSDGVDEAMNEAEEMYQTERLLEVIEQGDPDISAQEMVDLIVRDVTQFVGGVEPSDDITIVVLLCKE